MTVNIYRVLVSSDAGLVMFKTAASSKKAAAAVVMAAEECPAWAILKIEQVVKEVQSV